MIARDVGAGASFTVAPPAYQLPAGLRLGAVRLQVADLARSIAYYERVIGLRVIHATALTAHLGVPADGETLVELHEQPGATPVPQRGRLGLFHFAILLPERADLGAFVRHLHGIGEAAGMSDHVVSEAVYLSDPDGLGIEVYVDRPRATWQVRDGSLDMGTEPLDLASLLHAGEGRDWKGAPPGTRIGHVHLHVGDLAAASAFYHEALGFDRVALTYPGALFLSAGGYHHHLGTNTWAVRAARASERDARLLEWTIELPEAADVDAAARSLVESGVAVEHARADATAIDPWGTAVRLTRQRSGEWQAPARPASPVA